MFLENFSFKAGLHFTVAILKHFKWQQKCNIQNQPKVGGNHLSEEPLELVLASYWGDCRLIAPVCKSV